MYRECTLITTEVTPLSTQKYVPDLRAYCSENFLIISTDLSDGSTGKTMKIFIWKHDANKSPKLNSKPLQNQVTKTNLIN